MAKDELYFFPLPKYLIIGDLISLNIRIFNQEFYSKLSSLITQQSYKQKKKPIAPFRKISDNYHKEVN